MVKPGDQVSVREKSRSLGVINESIGRASRYNWLNVSGEKHQGVFTNYPNREEIPENINEQLIVELYSK